MFIGHFGVGMAAKKYAPEVSLGTLFIAVQFSDLLWPTLLLLNVEHIIIRPYNSLQPLAFIDYPVSHSLLMVLGWSLLFGMGYWLLKKNKRAATVLALCVFSHWLLDLVVHFPDLPLYPGSSAKLGFALWNYPMATAIAEGALFITGIIFYLRKTRARNAGGTILFWLLIFLLAAAHAANLFAPVPNSISAVAWGAQLQWIFVALAFWADHNRSPIAK
ncbi:MAG TPA: hypothetical protein PLD84_00585 [Chitinophagales bacterium]|nr:hypothetical protein [Chitinophagales bacterium]